MPSPKKWGDRLLTEYEKYWLRHEGLLGPEAKLNFIEIFKKERMEGEEGPEPSLYDMVILELLAKLEAIQDALGVKRKEVSP